MKRPKKSKVFIFLSAFLISGGLWVEATEGRPARADALIQVGSGALNDGFYDVAEKQFSLFLKDYSTHERVLDVVYLLGRTFFLQGKFKEAKAQFTRILTSGKPFEQTDFALFWNAVTATRLDDTDSARRYLVELIRRFPRFEWIDYAHYLLGLIELEKENLSSAESSLRAIAQLAKRKEVTHASAFWLGLLAYRRGDYATAAGYLRPLTEEAIPSLREREKEALFWLAETEVKRKRYKEAMPRYKSYAERFKGDPLNVAALWRMSFCAYRLGDLKEAREILDSIHARFKNWKGSPYVHYLLSLLYLEQGDFSSSVKELPLALGRPSNPLWGGALLCLYWNCLQLGATEEADKAFQRLLKFADEDEKLQAQWLNAEITFLEGRIADALPYYFNLVNSRFRERALYRIGKGYFLENQPRDAVTNLDILFLEFPASKYIEEGLLIKGEALWSSGNFKEAITTLSSLVQRQKSDPWSLLGALQLGSLYLARKDEKEAEKIFQTTAERAKDHPLAGYAFFQLGNIAFNRKKTTEALQHYSEALKRKPSNLMGEISLRMGEAFYEEGMFEKALLHFQKAIEELPEGSSSSFLAYLEVGSLQKRKGKWEEARKAYRTVTERSKDETLVKAARELLRSVESR